MEQININFDPIEHRYYDDNNNTFISVTQLIHGVQPVFNKRYWSMYTALKNKGFKVRPVDVDRGIINVNGINRTLDYLYKIYNGKVKEVVKDWKEKTDVSIERGNNIHNHLEDSINKSKDDDGSSNEMIKPLINKGFEVFESKHDLDKTDLEFHYPDIYNRLLAYINKGCTIYAEKRIYNSKFFVAGTIDVLIIKGKKFAILDWKTNKDEMMFHSGYYKKIQDKLTGKWIRGTEFVRTDDRLLSPIDYIQNCKGMIYSLQLSVYAYMMELWGYELVPDGLEIFHIRPNMKPKLIRIQYLKKEAEKLLEFNLNSKQQERFVNKNKTVNFGI